jgi:hypothetical protein
MCRLKQIFQQHDVSFLSFVFGLDLLDTGEVTSRWAAARHAGRPAGLSLSSRRTAQGPGSRAPIKTREGPSF